MGAELVLVMSVHPGWAGQSFMPEVLPKFAELRSLCRPGTLLSIDGGIGVETGREAVRAGAGMLVAGTFLFGSAEMAGRVAALKALGGEGEA